MSPMRILLIHTGGTIGMVRSDDGFRPEVGVVEEEAARLCREVFQSTSITVQRLEPLIDSANATPQDWNRITETISAKYADFDGFLVTHGTDTLTYTAAALTMALQGLAKPVVMTGSMLPLTEPDNDGHRNLHDAITAVQTARPGVWVQFAGRLLHGGRIRKTHSDTFDAFAAVPSEAPPLHRGDMFQRHAFAPCEVAILPVAPGASSAVLSYAAAQCDGIVLRCFGSGTVPNTPDLMAALQNCARRNVPVIAVSQCAEGRIALGTYAAGAILKQNDVGDGRDMTMEAAYVKMVLALGRGGDVDEMRRFLTTPLAGELTAVG